VRAALADAQRVRADGAGDLTTIDDVAGDGAFRDESEPPGVVALEERRPRRSGWRSAISAAGIAALVGTTMVAVTAIGDRGGASSPEGAVRALAEALDAEDALAAVDVLAPDEVRTLRATIDAASRRAEDLALVERATEPFAGLDVSVDDLTLAPEELADGYVKVHLTGGTLAAEVQRGELSDVLQRVSSDGATPGGSVSFADVNPFDADPFVVAIRRDDSWYVSAAYTALEYVRVANDLPAAEYGAALARPDLGADSPEAAAREFATALGARDWNRVFALLPPNELPLYDYRAGLGRLLDEQQFDFTVDTVDASAQIDGDRATVTVSASGTTGTGDGPGSWNLAGDCVRTEYADGSETYAYGTCLSERGVLPVQFFGAPQDGPTTVEAVRHDGRWFLSPVATALDVLDAWVGNFDERALHSLLGDHGAIEPDGHIALGEPATVRGEGYGLGYAYTFEGRAGQRVVGQVDANRPYDGLGAVLIAPDGTVLEDGYGVLYGEPVQLPVTGTYKLVAVHYAAGEQRFTLWDVRDAPDGVIYDGGSSGASECIVEDANGFVYPCDEAASGGTTATTFAPAP
jgi:hypothetical protein